ncbi:sigma-70 family RNA polymerase sigma factor, partial [Bacteriovoracaceae bacterium]|nr:sigma-70 family RNA polymerase sigma factor [Bacteriovoracaceae bacterium]
MSDKNKKEAIVNNENLPVESRFVATDLVPKKDLKGGGDSLTRYIQEINRYELLSPEQEKELTSALAETGDIDIAKRLVVANLRLVVKIAMEYRRAYSNVLDLIQEGNIGLMKAVSKYDATKGAKLSYYASWWIKSYILKFILDNFRLVKVGTTAEQKKLFYNLFKEKEKLEKQGIDATPKLIAQNLGVSEQSVEEMNLRLGELSGDYSIDYRQDDQSGSKGPSLGESLASDDESIEDNLAKMQGIEILEENLVDFVKDLKPRDQDIFKKRLLTEVPPSLQSIANDYGVSRE